MGLNRVSNPAKVRKLEARLGKPVLAAYARWFAEQTTLLVFTGEREAYVVPKVGEPEPYGEPVYVWRNAQGVICGFGQGSGVGTESNRK
jgi:hypothetical protein